MNTRVGLGGQRPQQRELLLRTARRASRGPRRGGPARRRRGRRPAGGRRTGGGSRGAGAPRPAAQLGVAERLGHVVVAAAVEPPQAVELAAAAGEDQHRDPRVDPAGDAVRLADGAQEVEARAVGQADVEHDEVGVLRLEQAAGVPGAVGDEQLEAVGGEVVGQEGAGGVVVLDEEDRRPRGVVGGHAGSRAPTRRPLPPCRSAGLTTVRRARSTVHPSRIRPVAESPVIVVLAPRTGRTSMRRRPRAAAENRGVPLHVSSRASRRDDGRRRPDVGDAHAGVRRSDGHGDRAGRRRTGHRPARPPDDHARRTAPDGARRGGRSRAASASSTGRSPRSGPSSCCSSGAGGWRPRTAARWACTSPRASRWPT